jgi:hypothetical protein
LGCNNRLKPPMGGFRLGRAGPEKLGSEPLAPNSANGLGGSAQWAERAFGNTTMKSKMWESLKWFTRVGVSVKSGCINRLSLTSTQTIYKMPCSALWSNLEYAIIPTEHEWKCWLTLKKVTKPYKSKTYLYFC